MLKHKVAITLKNGKVLEGYFSSDLTDPYYEIIRNEILGLNNKQAFSQKTELKMVLLCVKQKKLPLWNYMGENNMDYIDRQKAIKELQLLTYWDEQDEMDVIDTIVNIPSEPFAPRAEGYWIVRSGDDLGFPIQIFAIERLECSLCHEQYFDRAQAFKEKGYYKYCPNCGAIMGVQK